MASVFNRGTRDRPNWYAKVKDRDGRWRMVATKQRTKALALRWALEKESATANSEVGIVSPSQESTFGEAAVYWLRNHSEAACTSHDDNVGRMKHLTEAFGDLLLSEITALRIVEFTAKKKRATKLEGGAAVPQWQPATINRMLALLRKVLNDCVSWGFSRSAPKIKLLPEPEHDFTFLDHAEASRFLDWTRKHAPRDFPLYAAAIYTGARMGELWGARWSEFDLARRTFTICRSYDQDYTKSKKIRRVPLNQEILAILQAWKHEKAGDEVAFPGLDGKSIRPRERPPLDFEEHLAGAQCHPVTFHDLRHTAASLMVMSGMNLRTVQKILGHSSVQVTERYAHLAPDYMASDVDKFSLGVRGPKVRSPRPTEATVANRIETTCDRKGGLRVA